MRRSAELGFIDTVRRESLLPEGARVTAAVSGGSDSVGMLLLLDRFRGHMRWTLSVLHIDHRYRPTSGEDAEFVGNLAASLGLPFELRRLPARRRGGSPEADFSEARRRIYGEAAGEGLVAVGHTADDRAETLLLRLMEGAGLRGLGGMDYRGEGPVRRPLLDLTRAEVRGYLVSRGASWREDETNLDTGPARNRLRHGALARLEADFPGASRRLAASSAGLASWRRVADGVVASAMEGAGTGLGSVDRLAFASLERAVRLSVLWEVCGRPRSGWIELEKTVAWLSSGGSGEKLLPGGVSLHAGEDELIFERGGGRGWTGRSPRS